MFKFFLSYPINNETHSEFIEITDFVDESSVGNLKQNLSSNEYDIGTIKFNKINVKLTNETSFFSEAENQLSVFTFKRDQSILKITWDINNHGISCGNFPCGYTFLSSPVEVYRGLLEDNSSKFDSDTQIQTFNFLGMESIIGKVQVDFSALSVLDDIETTIFNIINQSDITKILLVDQSNINVKFNFIPNDISELEDKKCLDALDEILFLAGAVLYVKGTDIIVASRDGIPTSKAIFYGPSSDDGIENILNLSEFTLGLNRTFNFFKWEGTSIKQSFADSIEKNGFKDKVLKSTLVTNSVLQTNILNSLLVEFGFPKRELEIKTPMTTQMTKNVFLLDTINIDYPSDYREPEDGSLPARYGQARYGEAKYVKANSSIVISPAIEWKIMNRAINIKTRVLTFRVREQ